MKLNKKYVFYLLLCILGLVFIIITSSNKNRRNNYIKYDDEYYYNLFPFTIEEVFNVEPKVSLELIDDGYDIYVPERVGYRYGPSIIINDDGTIDAWFASNGDNRIWDWITYRHFNGEWSKEKIVLKPTSNSLDHYSTCDPGVIYFDGYYYIGYTSTTNADKGGVENSIFVARSENPDGPFEKWDGQGWSDNPSPIIKYENEDGYWGYGEISFVVYERQLYCYYSLKNSKGSYTMVSIADLCENWPSTLENKGIAINVVNNQGSCDVVYLDEYRKFLSFSIEDNFGANSRVAVYESKDGINFKQIDTVKGIEKFSHNMGVSKRKDGHISLDDDLFIGYAYGEEGAWGKWSTKLQGIIINVVK